MAEPEPTQVEVDTLADLIAEAHLLGIYAGSSTLARWILRAGYRRVAEPVDEPGTGRCRVCNTDQPMKNPGQVARHDNARGECCPGGLLTPEGGSGGN